MNLEHSKMDIGYTKQTLQENLDAIGTKRGDYANLLAEIRSFLLRCEISHFNLKEHLAGLLLSSVLSKPEISDTERNQGSWYATRPENRYLKNSKGLRQDT
jgi:hypothetical protein